MALIRLYSQGGVTFGTEHSERALVALLVKFGGVDYNSHWNTAVHSKDDEEDIK